jgi:two-component system sensor histidine kinase DesK
MTVFKKLHEWLLPKSNDIGYAAYVNLFFLSLFFGNLYFKPAEGLNALFIAASTILFVICYFRSFWGQDKELAFYILMFCLIGVVTSEINLGGSVFFVYAAAACAQFSTKNKAIVALLIILIAVIAYSIGTEKSSYFWIPAVFISITFGIFNIQRTEVLEKNKALNYSQQAIGRNRGTRAYKP